MELRLPLEMSPGREAACRAVFGTWGFFPNDARKNCPFVLTAFTGWSSERCPGIGFLSRGDREIGVLRNVEPPTRPRLECPREKPHTGAAAREQPRDSPVIERGGPSSPAWPSDQSRDLSPNASGGLTPFSPPSELQEIPVAIREQSGVLCFHSRWMPVSPGVSGMQPRDPCRPWRGTLASGHKPR